MRTYTEKGLSRPGHYECTALMTGLAKASEYRRRPSRGREVETHTHLIIQSSYLDVMKCYEKPFSSHTNQPNRDGKKNSFRPLHVQHWVLRWVVHFSPVPFSISTSFPLTPIDVCINGTYFKVNGGCFTWALRLDISIWVASRLALGQLQD